MAILAIDQGATKTAVVIAQNNGTIMGAGLAEGACHFTAGVEKALEVISLATDNALRQADLRLSNIERISAGLSGANWPDEIEMLQSRLRSLFSISEVEVCNDCIVALRGGTDKPNGIVLCAGSGFNSAVMIDGKIRTVLNNYIEMSDQGGDALGARVLNTIFRSRIGIQAETGLTAEVMEYFGYNDIDHLLLAFQRNQLEKPLKNIAFILFKQADMNDRVALIIVYEFAKSISRYATASIEKYRMAGMDCDVVLSGGIFMAKNPLLVETISTQVHRVSSRAHVVNARFDPVVGALLMGLDRMYGNNEAVKDNCKKSAKKLGLLRFQI